MTRFLILPLCSALLFSGCASQTPATQPENASVPPAPATISYDSDTLANLLVAEVAAQRQALGVTLAYYSQAARTTEDPQVISQAAQLASYLEDHQQAEQLSELWLEQAPADEEALRLAILSEIRLGNTQAATYHLNALIGEHGQDGLGRLVAQARGLDEEGNIQLLQALAQLTDSYPDQAPLWFARALWLEHSGEHQAALDADQQALKIMPRHEDALLLKAQLLYELDEEKKALRHLKKMVRLYPEARRPRLTYVRLLLATGNLKEADKQLHIMAEQNPQDLDLHFSLALLALEAGATDTARENLLELQQQNYRPNEINLYLAQADEQDGNLDSATAHYLQVEGPQGLRAQVQAARLLYQQGKAQQGHQVLETLRQQQPELRNSLILTEAEMRNSNGDSNGALQQLNDALAEQPDNTDLLYTRAMITETTGNLAQMEQDLARVLALEPDNATALNALGYTLANRNLRLDEAHDYVAKALALRPDDPAILDSMGWVLYRQGKLAEARDYLRRAYEKFPDPEVAAHYGEVLWVLGAQGQAREVWRDTLEADPDAPHIREVMDRLGARL